MFQRSLSRAWSVRERRRTRSGALGVPGRRPRQGSEPQAPEPVVKVPRHSAGDASRLAALLLSRICPLFSLGMPCQSGASPVSVQHATLHHGLLIPEVTGVDVSDASDFWD